MPIVPVMAIPCEPPFVIFRLDYVELIQWRRLRRGLPTAYGGCSRRSRRLPAEKVWRYRRWDDRLQPFDFADFLFAKRRDFCGREWLFEEIERWRAEPDGSGLLITGDPGIGKSAIVAQLVHANPAARCWRTTAASSEPRDAPARPVRPQRRGPDRQPARRLCRLLDDPNVEAALGEARCVDDPFSAFEEGILDPLHALARPAGARAYLLIDALDEALAVRRG